MKRGGGRDRLLVVLVLPPSATGPGALQDRQAVGVLVAHEARVNQRTQQHHDHRHRHPLGSWKNRDYTTQGVPGRVIYTYKPLREKRKAKTCNAIADIYVVIK